MSTNIDSETMDWIMGSVQGALEGIKAWRRDEIDSVDAIHECEDALGFVLLRCREALGIEVES